MDSKHHWTHLIPVNEGDSATLIQKFFSCVAALMSIQLRSLVLNSLKDFLEFLKMYQVSLSHVILVNKRNKGSSVRSSICRINRCGLCLKYLRTEISQTWRSIARNIL